jgi:hypothetical protein
MRNTLAFFSLNIWLFTLLSLLIISCSGGNRSTLHAPSDSVVKQIIIQQYTAQNEMDGIELVTVDTILIHKKTVSTKDSRCAVNYTVRCSYQPAALSPGHVTQRPASTTDAAITLYYRQREWKQ